MQNNIPLQDQLIEMEISLQDKSVMANPAKVQRLLHAEFSEVGGSGRSYNHQTIMQDISDRADSKEKYISTDFCLDPLADDVVLLTYMSAVVLNGEVINETKRSSIWVMTEDGWKIRYHQGTPAGSTGLNKDL